MKETAVAERYSRALFEALAEKKTVLPETIKRQLGQVAQLVHSNEQIKIALENPLVPIGQKKMLLQKNLKTILTEPKSPLFNFIDLLVSKKRLNLLPLILSKFEQMIEESRESIKAYVKSAAVLDQKMKNEIELKLSRLFKKNVKVETSVNPELLAGVVVQAGDTVIDNSLRTQLRNIKVKLNERGV